MGRRHGVSSRDSLSVGGRALPAAVAMLAAANRGDPLISYTQLPLEIVGFFN